MTNLLLTLLTALEMLSSFMRYVVNDYQPIDTLYGCFGARTRWAPTSVA